MEILACPNLAVPAQVMRHVVHVESSANPFAIGVVGAQLVRQPKTLEEAVATAKMLESGNYNYSLGAAQVNRVNFRKYGLDSHEKAFDLCTNLAAGASILANCYASAGGDWGKAFSCYYSGNFVTGFRNGYVQKIFDSISRERTIAEAQTPPVGAIPLRTGIPTASAITRAEAEQPTTAASRISMRVVPTTLPAPMAPPATASVPSLPAAAARSDVFVPQVRLPSAGIVPAASAQAPAAAPANSPAQRADDGAFVF